MNTLETFYNFVIDEMNDQVINHNLLMDKHIKSYMIEKLTQKSVNYPEFLNFDFKNEADFNRFNKNLQGEIYRLFLTLVRAAKKYNPIKTKIEKKLEKAIISYLDLKNCFIDSLNAVVSMDGKKTELQDLIPAKSWETYEEAGDRQSALIEVETEEKIKIKPKNQKRIKSGNLQPAFAF